MRVVRAACESPASSATPNDSSHLLFYCHSWSQFTLLVPHSAHEHQALASPHYFDELFLLSTHEGLIEDQATQAGFREHLQLQDVGGTGTGTACLCWLVHK